MDYYLFWMMGREIYDGSDHAELIETAQRIPNADVKAWYTEWSTLAQHVEAEAFFRMYEYLRGANGAKGYWSDLAKRLDLDVSRKIGNFSRGNKQKVGIVAAWTRWCNKP